MIGKVAKFLLKTVGLVAGLAVLAYFIALLINWNDVPPSDLALEYQAVIDNRPAVADADNAFILLRDFSEDGTKPFDQRPSESEFAIALAEDCNGLGVQCLEQVKTQQYGAQHWLEEHDWILDRYLKLLSYDKFQEPIPENHFEIAGYGPAGYGQHLLMMSAMLSAVNGDQPHVIALLEADLKFWRMALAESNLIITKLITAAYARNHFIEGNLVLQTLHETHRTHTLPLGWLDDINDEEISMRHAMIGEWAFIGRNYDAVFAQDRSFLEQYIDVNETVLERIWTRILSFFVLPLAQAQDSKNMLAAEFEQVIRHYDVPLHEIPIAAATPVGKHPDRAEPYSRIYNIAGDSIFPGLITYSDYFVRPTDLEGVRRAAVVATQMREQEISVNVIEEVLNASPYTNPYTDEAFTWDSESGEIVFQGLRDRDDGIYRIRY